MKIDTNIQLDDLRDSISRFWELSGQKIRDIYENYDSSQGSPVFTLAGKYNSRGWTEWTEGFLYGSVILQYEVSGDDFFLQYGKKATIEKMPHHIAHFGVHDHGFNNISTYGNLLRLIKEEKIGADQYEIDLYRTALKVSGAVQAKRWTNTKNGGGYIYSFNGPHSLFVDTIRSLRSLIVSHELGFSLWGENDAKVNLLERAVHHAISTAQYSVYYGEGRDHYDIRGRTAHESIFNTNDGQYRCPNSQQGYSPFSTWTRGLAWAILGFAEQLEYLHDRKESLKSQLTNLEEIVAIYAKAATATADFYLEFSSLDGIPYWDTGAPFLYKLGDYTQTIADPFNNHEPVDSSAAAIAAQGLFRLGRYLSQNNHQSAQHYSAAGRSVLKTLLEEPYLSTDPNHQGILLHSIYHRPNGWDNIPPGEKIPANESSMWGDYHMRELVLYVWKQLNKDPYYTFYNCV